MSEDVLRCRTCGVQVPELEALDHSCDHATWLKFGELLAPGETHHLFFQRVPAPKVRRAR